MDCKPKQYTVSTRRILSLIMMSGVSSAGRYLDKSVGGSLASTLLGKPHRQVRAVMSRVGKVLPILLALCLLSVGSLAVGQAVAHDFYHHNHSAHDQHAAHGTILCSWLCAAGQGWEVTSAPQSGEGVPSSRLESQSEIHSPLVHSIAISSRGPPII
ncbi:MAG: hypothetical protein NNA25_13300 [Nitrospira sp.]|nr:hypothetical protein [Nitrospira sp.]